MKRGGIVLIIAAVVVVIIVLVVIFASIGSSLSCSGTSPNKCNGQCWENCSAYRVFQCKDSGGVCAIDITNCPPETPNPCNDNCWGACDAGQTFICNSTAGGQCKKG